MGHIILDSNDFGKSFLGIGDSGLTGVLGYAVVFIGLCLLLAVLVISGSIFKAKAKKAAAAIETPAEPLPVPVPEAKTAPGSAGEVKLYDVPDKEAAMIIAIVADKLQKPLNELRFISIKEVKDDEI